MRKDLYEFEITGEFYYVLAENMSTALEIFSAQGKELGFGDDVEPDSIKYLTTEEDIIE